MSFTTVTLTGTYHDNQGRVCRGTVSVQATADMAQPGVPIAVANAWTVTLDATGSVSINVPATDDPTTAPTGVTYRVTELINDAPARIYYIAVPHTSGTLDLSTVAPALPTTPLYPYVLQSSLGADNGVATLDDTGNVPLDQLGNAPSGGGVNPATLSRIALSGTVSVPSGSATFVDWSTLTVGEQNGTDVEVTGSNLVVNTTGVYAVTAYVSWEDNTSGTSREVVLDYNVANFPISEYSTDPGKTGAPPTTPVGFTYFVAAVDELTMILNQDSGSTLSVGVDVFVQRVV